MNWKPLQLSTAAAERLPAFLISAEFTTDSYTINLTDLTNIWNETLEKKDIIRQSRRLNISIDPSEDDDQLQIFLDKIKSALEGAEGTTLALHVENERQSPAALRLQVKVALPGGLRDLEWSICLDAENSRETAYKLVLPIVSSLQEKNREVDEMVKMLQEKDSVIQKLIDTLEQQGVDLGVVFHQAAGRAGRKVDRKKASERVKGLGPFDIDIWRKGLVPAHVEDVAGLLDNVFGKAEALELPSRTAPALSHSSNTWWKDLSGETILLTGSKTPVEPKTPPKAIAKSKDSSPDEADDFQVQATPPHLSKSKQKAPIDESTDDDDDNLDGPSQSTRIPDSFPISQSHAPSPPKAPPKKLGTIGSKRKDPTPTPPQIDPDDSTADDEPIHSSNSKTINNDENDNDNDNDNDDDTTEDDATEDDTPPPTTKPQKTPAKSPTPPAPSSSKKKGKLGQLKSKKPASPAPPSRSPTASPERETTASQPKKGIGKIGKIGKIGANARKKESTQAPAASTPEPDELPERLSTPTSGSKKKIGGIGRRGARSQTEVLVAEERGRETEREEMAEREREKTPPPRETSQERADRKRDELKRELEAKAKVPVKKKRKF